MANQNNGYKMYEIGHSVIFNNTTDRNHRITNKFRRHLSVVDLVPVDFAIDLAKLVTVTNNEFISYYYDSYPNSVKNFTADVFSALDGNTIKSPIDLFVKTCNKYELDIPESTVGLRLLTTSDTVAQDDISSEYAKNKIAELINSISSYGPMLKSLGQLNVPTNNAAQRVKVMNVELKRDGRNANNAEIATTVGTIAKQTLLDGFKISLPKIWESTQYSPSFNFNIDLVSPYGTEKAIREFIVKPLTTLLVMGSPISSDGLLYGNPRYVTTRAYGVSEMLLSTITNISVKRGSENTLNTSGKLPRSIEVNLEIKPALGGFGVLYDKTNRIKPFSNYENMSIPLDEITANKTFGPGIVLVDNIINSLRPIPTNLLVGSDSDAINSLGHTIGNVAVNNVTNNGIIFPINTNTIRNNAAKEINTLINDIFSVQF